jgi:DNA gyrase subunit A
MLKRPDLTQVDPEVRAYIENLEKELDFFRGKGEDASSPRPGPVAEPAELPTTQNLVILTAQGIAKRTPRHLYQRQRRGGMGIFDIETPKGDYPTILAQADEKQTLLVFTNQARAFRVSLAQIEEMPVHGRGQSIISRLDLPEGEWLVAAIADVAQGVVALLSEKGMVRTLRHHVFGEYMRPGTSLFNPNQFGPLIAACRTPGNGDLLIVTRNGKAIRFSEKLVSPQGGPGIRLEPDDRVCAITAVDSDSLVFLTDEQGKGTIRSMNTFTPNKSSGGGGKIIMHTDCLISALALQSGSDIFLISQLSKIIRFQADEVPVKEGNVQGVACMSLRADLVTAAMVTKP